ncbi:hypothetical protein [uncultured Maribacter sp.]|uniref:hypothetical protein n=1 Tax=uncultured Maribacter sp. TaxID=431308 RepID=UPI00262C3341|nr:hypothetical protein [uncultured Maribacter sp.]
MNRNFFLLCIGVILCGLSLRSQEVDEEPVEGKFGNKVIYLVNNHVIANEKTLERYKEKIEDVSVLLEKPKESESYYSLSKNGILFVKLKTDLKNKTQKQLNTFFGLEEDNLILVNGCILENINYSIATQSIFSVCIIEPNSENKLKSKTLDILLYSANQGK